MTKNRLYFSRKAGVLELVNLDRTKNIPKGVKKAFQFDQY